MYLPFLLSHYRPIQSYPCYDLTVIAIGSLSAEDELGTNVVRIVVVLGPFSDECVLAYQLAEQIPFFAFQMNLGVLAFQKQTVR